MIPKAIAAVLLAAGAVSASVPIETSGARIVLRIRVNGEGPFPFALSAGTEQVALHESMLLHLGLAERPAGEPLVLENVAIGELVLNDVPARPRADRKLTLETPGSRGLLPLLLLESFLVTLDFRDGLLTIEEGALPEEDKDTIVPLEPGDEGTIAVAAQVDGLRVPLRLDLEKGGGLRMNPGYYERLPLLSDPEVIGYRAAPGGQVEMIRARFGGPVRIGRQDLDVRRILFDSEEPEASLGHALLRDHVVTLDLRNRRMRLVRVAGPPG